jgi:hypothetical protein
MNGVLYSVGDIKDAAYVDVSSQLWISTMFVNAVVALSSGPIMMVDGKSYIAAKHAIDAHPDMKDALQNLAARMGATL